MKKYFQIKSVPGNEVLIPVNSLISLISVSEFVSELSLQNFGSLYLEASFIEIKNFLVSQDHKYVLELKQVPNPDSIP